MLLFLLLLIAAYVITGFYIAQNSTATQTVNLFGWHWTGIHVWYPVAAAAIAIGVLFILYMMYAGLIHGVRAGSLRRRVVTHESTIGDLRGENTRLREENARMRGQLRGGTATGVPAATTATPYQQPAGPTTRPGYTQPTGTPGGTTTTTPSGRTTASGAYQPRPTFGQRVRGFFGGSREPTGY
jgi:hypothetical protein